MLCDTLASKLMMAGNTLAATVCFICAGNIDKTVEIWSRRLQSEHEGKSSVQLLQVMSDQVQVFFKKKKNRYRTQNCICPIVDKIFYFYRSCWKKLLFLL